jgi:transposase
MLAVTQIKYIRREVNQIGASYANVAKRVGVDYRTVKKYANQETFDEKQPQKRKATVMDPVKPILDKWLKEDLKKKKKYQRTAKRMFEQLVKHHSFKGSDRSVRGYISKRKKELKQERDIAAMPLESFPGTAQVDFGTAAFYYESKSIDLPYLVMSFPFSNTFLFQVFPSENTECLLEGLKRMFRAIGGVPKVIRFDNLAPAVKKVKAKGERELTEAFQRFVLHYGFEYEFCNPGKGNEKGHVEAMVKYVRNNFLLPECVITDLETLNQSAIMWSEEDRDRLHYKKGVLQSELYKQEEDAWLQLPEKDIDAALYQQVKADKYGIVRYDGKEYSTSPRFAAQKVLIQVTYNKIKVLTEEFEVIASHDRLYGVKRRSMIWQPYLQLLSKRPNAMKYTNIYEQFPDPWTRYLQSSSENEQKEALRLLSELLKNNDFTLLNQALELASVHGHPRADTIKQCFYSLLNQQTITHTAMIPSRRLPSMPEATRGLTHYDDLFGGDQG